MEIVQKIIALGEATEKGEAFDVTSPPMFRASVELLSITCVLALTEDRSVTKRILQKGSSRRQPETWNSRSLGEYDQQVSELHVGLNSFQNFLWSKEIAEQAALPTATKWSEYLQSTQAKKGRWADLRTQECFVELLGSRDQSDSAEL